MTYLVRAAIILMSLAVILGILAYFEPSLLSQLRLTFWDGPRQLQDLFKEKNRASNLEEINKSMRERREEIKRIVQALCKEEIGLCEAGRRVRALETELHLPPLRWLEPKEQWPQLLHLGLIEQAALELGNDPKTAERVLPRLVAEAREKLGIFAQIGIPLHGGQTVKGPAQLIPGPRIRAVAE